MATLIGYENLDTSPKRTQVYLATHKGEDYLSFMHRSFISFSYGGKNIEDFNLIATVSGDRWEHNGYAEFEDFTTTYDIIDGQFYWATSFRTNTFEFTLSTDSISQQQLDEFMRWFKPGQMKELIFAEHPNRAIIARVATVPQISMIPFEMKKDVKVNGISYTVSTTEYKGDITLSLVTDDPFWYAKINVFGSFNVEMAQENWKDANGNIILNNFEKEPDTLKIIIEDGIPVNTMVKDTMALGGDIYAMAEIELRSYTAIEVNQDEYDEHGGDAPRTWYWKVATGNEGEYQYYKGARIASEEEGEQGYLGIIGGAQMNSYGSIARLNNYNSSYDNETYFYYSGTAPAPITLDFTLQPIIDSNSYFIVTPSNIYSASLDNNRIPYNSIFIESIHTSELQLTTPNMFTSYNQIINMFNTQQNKSLIEIRKLIRDIIHHSVIRAWANYVLDIVSSDSILLTSEIAELAKQKMAKLFQDNNGETYTVRFIINSKTGDAKGIFTYNAIPEDDSNENENEDVILVREESVQDMCITNNLIIQDRNFPNEEGNIVKWQNINNTTKQYSHRIYHNFPNALFNMHVSYQNLYL